MNRRIPRWWVLAVIAALFGVAFYGIYREYLDIQERDRRETELIESLKLKEGEPVWSIDKDGKWYRITLGEKVKSDGTSPWEQAPPLKD